MEDFNTNLAGSMGDLKEFYQTNKAFTEGFSQDIKTLNDRFAQLFRSIDQLSEQQQAVIGFVDTATNTQKSNLDLLRGLSKEMTNSQQDIIDKYNTLWGIVKSDALKVQQILKIIDKTAEQQEKVGNGYLEILNTLGGVRDQLAASFASNVNQLSDAMEELKKSYNNDMSRNIKTFAEHVSLSNRIINQGFDSLVNKFENMDLILGKYLSGLAFNASDLAGTINALNNTVKAVEHSVKIHNSSVQELTDLILTGFKGSGSEEKEAE